jgi:putative SOS response-associated peptidase YedK
MCGRYFRRSDKQRIAEAFHLGQLPDGFVLPPDFNVAPTTHQPVIRQARDTGQRELVLMRWGMVPFFAKSLAEFKGFSTINAKAENVMNNQMWRVPFNRRRCLIPADGFYEWKSLTTLKKGAKQPFAFELASGQPFAFAGLWDAWKEPKKSPQTIDTWLQSFTILTTDPNELTAQVHPRMPVILAPADYDRWLAPTDPERPPLDLLRPYPADQMSLHPVDPRVGNVKNNEPTLCLAHCPPNSA